jgi:hypothetical protein
VRLLALLLTVVMMTGAAAQAAWASPEVPMAIDDAPDVGTPLLPEPVVVSTPDRAQARPHAHPLPAPGRRHAALVFRPPRPFAFR